MKENSLKRTLVAFIAVFLLGAVALPTLQGERAVKAQAIEPITARAISSGCFSPAEIEVTNPNPNGVTSWITVLSEPPLGGVAGNDLGGTFNVPANNSYQDGYASVVEILTPEGPVDGSPFTVPSGCPLRPWQEIVSSGCVDGVFQIEIRNSTTYVEMPIEVEGHGSVVVFTGQSEVVAGADLDGDGFIRTLQTGPIPGTRPPVDVPYEVCANPPDLWPITVTGECVGDDFIVTANNDHDEAGWFWIENGSFDGWATAPNSPTQPGGSVSFVGADVGNDGASFSEAGDGLVTVLLFDAYGEGTARAFGGVPPQDCRTPDGPTTTERWAGANRYTTSVRISEEVFPSGADVVFLATGQSFPDALAAGPAAATLNAPILLTATNQLPAAVSAELQRLNPSVIYLLGGPAAISPSVETQVDAATSADIDRIAGSNRYATAAAIAELAFPTAEAVYVAAGTGFADALSAGAPGGILGRPVILTANSAVPAASREQITRLANPDIIVLGGPNAVNAAVVAELDSLTTGSVRRVSGANRYATSVAVSSDAFATATTVFLTTGIAFPDALSAAPAAANLGAPILLTTPACAPAEVIAEVTRLGATNVIVLGGTNAVSNATAALTPCPVSSSRLALDVSASTLVVNEQPVRSSQ